MEVWNYSLTSTFVWTTHTQVRDVCHKAYTVCLHTSHQQAKVGGGREWTETCFCSPPPGIGRSGHLSSIRISWFIAGIAEQQITPRLPFYQRRTYACLFSNSVAPRLNSGTMPRCANWDKGLKLTMIYLIFTFQLIILNAVAQILLALLMYTAVSYCTLMFSSWCKKSYWKKKTECTLLTMLCTQSIAEVNVDAKSEHAMSALKRIIISHFYFHICK